MQALLPLELCGMWISVGNVWGQVLALPCSLLIEPYIRTMEGACILRKELEGIVSTACVTGYGLNLKVACGIIPDLIVTLKGKTLCFVLASYAAAGNRAQLGEILDRWVLRRAEGSCCALRRQGSRVQGPACVQGCKRKCRTRCWKHRCLHMPIQGKGHVHALYFEEQCNPAFIPVSGSGCDGRMCQVRHM